MALTFAEARQLSIVGFLSQHGFEPKRVRGNDYWYLSPFRTEKEPSFKVDNKLNLWYDHGIGEGGNIIDLGTRLFNCSPVEFLRKMHDHGPSHNNIKSNIRRESKLRIAVVGPLGDPALLQYLSERGIAGSDAQRYCQEVDFTVGDRPYKAVGFQNRSGGYELRNHWFKGSSSPKDVTLIDRGSRQLCLMEGFIDFLSILQLSRVGVVPHLSDSDFLVLNSVSMLKRNVHLLDGYSERRVFFDNDEAGQVGKMFIQEAGYSFADASTLYSDYKDVNEFLFARQGRVTQVTRSPRINR